jgi:predicted AlkP superfamily pyrophosphatase or phosphodiesterase
MATAPTVDMRCIAPTVCRLLGTVPPDNAEVPSVPEIIEALAGRKRIALIVLDALGLATLQAHPAAMPFLDRAMRAGSRPMQAVYPPVTPVNFATMATGLSPARHGIRDRGEKLTSDTIFDALRRGRCTSGAAARAASTLNILLAAKADTAAAAETDRDADVVRGALGLFARAVPDFVWVQLLDADDAQHAYGVGSSMTGRVLPGLDRHLARLVTALRKHAYGVIICADHGQHDRADGRGGTHDGTDTADMEVPLVWMR